jgi:hypothetical protein
VIAGAFIQREMGTDVAQNNRQLDQKVLELLLLEVYRLFLKFQNILSDMDLIDKTESHPWPGQSEVTVFNLVLF